MAKIDFNPYEILELSRECTDDEIVKAYRKVALKWHPDKNPERKEFATEIFQKVSRSLEILSDPSARAAYDKVLNAKSRRIVVKRRRQTESENRRKLIEELERREADAYNEQFNSKQAERDFEKEVNRLRKEGSKLLQEEIRNLERELNRTHFVQPEQDKLSITIQVKWKRSNMTNIYDEAYLTTLFRKYGTISAIVCRTSKASAVIDFDTVHNLNDMEKESGDPKNPLLVKVLTKVDRHSSSTPSASKHIGHQTGYKMPSESFDDFERRVLAAMVSDSDQVSNQTNATFTHELSNPLHETTASNFEKCKKESEVDISCTNSSDDST